ncbi:hypothetical protein ZWY2020_050917 [Hordeum vulgare]|nr:hypothetical protein ZWY2020_050917 [Hordeum vulgare]
MAQRDHKQEEPTELQAPEITLCANSCSFPGKISRHAEPLPELLPGRPGVRRRPPPLPYRARPCRPPCSTGQGPRRWTRSWRTAVDYRATATEANRQDVGEPVLQLPEAGQADRVSVPVRRRVLRRAPVLGPE